MLRRGGRLALLAVCLLGLAASGAAQEGQLGVLRSGSYYERAEPGGGVALVAPRAAVVSGLPLGAATLQLSPTACSEICRNTTGCSWFQYCEEQVREFMDEAWLVVSYPACTAAPLPSFSRYRTVVAATHTCREGAPTLLAASRLRTSNASCWPPTAACPRWHGRAPACK